MKYLPRLLGHGLTVTFNNDKVYLKPTNLVTTEIISYVKKHKSELIKELGYSKQTLTVNQILWLGQIANHLHINDDFLLEHKFIDEFDLVEQVNNDPKLIANSIKSSPKWLNTEKPVYSVELAKPKMDAPIVYQADRSDPAHDKYINHLMTSKGSCCYAPANRYCEIGQLLKSEYERGTTL